MLPTLQRLPLSPALECGSWQHARTLLSHSPCLHLHIEFCKIQGALSLGGCWVALRLVQLDATGADFAATPDAGGVQAVSHSGSTMGGGGGGGAAQHPAVVLREILEQEAAMLDMAMYDAAGHLLLGR